MSKEIKICKYIKHTNKNCEFVEIYSPLSLRNTAAIQFNVGSVDDSIHGLAHMTEHLITNASSISNQNLDFEKEGIKMNAYTYKERMIFFASSYILQPESVVNKLIQSFNWNPNEKDLLIEKNTILSEMSENNENIYKAIFNKIIESCVTHKIADESYLHNLVGSTNTVKKIKIHNVKGFIQEKLTKPLLVITSAKKLSKLQVNTIHKLLESSFKFTTDELKTNSKQIKNKNCSINFAIKNTQIKGFAFNSQDHKKDFIYLGLLKQYLGGDWSSITNQKMRINKQLTYFVYSGMSVFKDFSYFYIQYDVTNENKKSALQEVNSIFDELRKGIVNEDIFIASKNMRISNVYVTFKNEYDLIDDFLVSNSNFSLPAFYTLEEYLNDVRDVKIEDFRKYIRNIFY